MFSLLINLQQKVVSDSLQRMVLGLKKKKCYGHSCYTQKNTGTMPSVGSFDVTNESLHKMVSTY